MKQLFFAFPGNETLAATLAQISHNEIGQLTIRNFPDGETYIRINSDVQNRHVVVICTLFHPNEKILPLCYLAQTAKELGASSVSLIAPYLAYMRQDKRFEQGEAITSVYFAKLLSSFLDKIITIDPHLHRRKSLDEIYTIPSVVLHAAPVISKWISENIIKPVLVGPDVESKQWVSEVAHNIDAPFFVLQKTRKGDNDVEISIPNVKRYVDHTPVLVDDIISTGSTMIATITHLKNAEMKKPVCIGVHGLFANDSYQKMLNAGADRVVTCNTIQHISNAISIDELISKVL